MSRHHNRRETTKDKIALFEKVDVQLRSFYREIGLISKKKPSEQLNTFKLGFINQTLAKANDLLGDEYRPFPDFTIFDVAGSLTTASDVVMMLDQYSKAFEKYKDEHVDEYSRWITGEPEDNEDATEDEEYDDEEVNNDAEDDEDDDRE